MMKPEVTDSRMRDVIEFEVNYAVKTFEKELKDKDDALSKKDIELSKKDIELSEITKETERLKTILKAHDIAF